MNDPIRDLPEAPLKSTYRAKSRLCWLLALASLVVGAASASAVQALASDQALVVFPLILFGAGLMVTFLCALIFAWYAPMEDRHLGEFRRGEYLARWTYDPREWASFTEDELGNNRSNAGFVALLFIVPTVLVGAIVGLTGGDLVASAITVAIGVTIGLVTAGCMLLIGQAAYRRARKTVGVAYIGREAAWFNGFYCSWATFGAGLLGADLEEGGARTVLTLAMGTDEQRSTSMRILVPAGKEEEARDVLRRLR